MKYYFLFLISLFVTLQTICFSQNVSFNSKLISELDTTFQLILLNHIDELKQRGKYDTTDKFIIMLVISNVSTADKVPKRILDSIYESCVFPLSSFSPSYGIIVSSVSEDCKSINSILGYKYKFCSTFDKHTIFIVSSNNIKFANVESDSTIIVCQGQDCDKDCVEDYFKYTTYIYHPEEILQSRFNTIWSKYPHSIIHPYKSMQKY